VAQSPSNDAKFRAIFDAHLPTVQRYCVRRLGTADANDAVSEVFLVAWRRLDDIPGDEETLPWLLGVARNAVRNIERGRRRTRRLSAKAHSVREADDPGPEVLVVRHSEYTEVAAALDTLSADDREIIRLRAWEELTAPQIATVLGVSVAAAEKRVSRALQRLTSTVGKRDMVRPRVIRQGGDV